MELDGVAGPPALLGVTNRMKKKNKNWVLYTGCGLDSDKSPPTGQCPKKRSTDGWTDRGMEGWKGWMGE